MAFLIVGAVQLIGFTSSGIAAGSTAAAMMSAAGTVAAGSTVAVLQSIGATGAVSGATALAANLGLGAAVGGGVAVVLKKFRGRGGGNGEDKKDNASDVDSHEGDDKGGKNHQSDVDDGDVSEKADGSHGKKKNSEDNPDQTTKAVGTVENPSNVADGGTSSINTSIDSLDDQESDDEEGDAGSDQHNGDIQGPRVAGPEGTQHIDGIDPDMPDGSGAVVDVCANQSCSDGTTATVFSSGSMSVKINVPGVELGSVEENGDGDLIDMATGDIVQEI